MVAQGVSLGQAHLLPFRFSWSSMAKQTPAPMLRNGGEEKEEGTSDCQPFITASGFNLATRFVTPAASITSTTSATSL